MVERLHLLTDADKAELKRIQRKLANIVGPDVSNHPEGVAIGSTVRQANALDDARRNRVVRLRVHTIQNDYLVCHTWDGTTEGTDAINVAKPYKLRHVAGNYPGVSSLSTTSSQEVDVTVGGEDETWILPDELEYGNDDEIYATYVQGTGVTVSGNDLQLIDLNVDGRAWILKE